jgi:RimJ/RimL family protein N-acetyltransferase
MDRVLEPVTARLVLRQWRESDLEPFAKMGRDPRVMEFFPELLSRDSSDAIAAKWHQRIAGRGWGFWAVEITATGEFAGFVGLDVPDTPLPFSPCIEIGWRLAHEHWGKGYATEGASAAVRAGFEQIGLGEIVAYAVVANRRSRSVMEKLGMRDTGETFDHPKVHAESPLRAHCLYRLPRDEWERGSGSEAWRS